MASSGAESSLRAVKIEISISRVFDYKSITLPESSTVSAHQAQTASARACPTHVVVAVVFQVRDGSLQVLLWQRARDPFAGAWALPGGYLEPGETLEGSIRRHLANKVDVRELSHLEQLETRSEPERAPHEWQLATAYLGLVPSDAEIGRA